MDPQFSDVSLVERLWHDGSFVGVAVLVVYLGLFVAAKFDKKHAFYWATGLAGVAAIVESIRQGSVPGAAAILHMLGPTIGLLIVGPGHEKSPAVTKPDVSQ